MSKTKELAKNTAILTIGKICTQFISFFLLPLYTSLLTPDEYGIADLFNTYASLLLPIIGLQLENGLFRFLIDVRNDKNGQKIVFSTVFMMNLLQIFVYLVFFLVIQSFLKFQYKYYLLISVSLSVITNSFFQFARGIGNNFIYALGSFISAISTIVANIILIFIMRLGIFGLLCATIIGQLITVIFLFCFLHVWNYISFLKFDKNILHSIMRYSIPLVPNTLSWWVLGASDRIVLSHFISTTINGLFAVASKFSNVFSSFYNIFNMSWTESVSLHMNDDDRDVFLSEVINTMFNVFISMCICIIAVMPFVFPIMVNEEYKEAYFQIPILMFGVMFQIIVGLYSVIYIALKKTGEIAKTSMVIAGLNLFIDIGCVKFIGIYAASISTFFSFGIMAIYRYFHVKKYVNVVLRKKNIYISLVISIIVTIFYYFQLKLINIIVLLLSLIYSVFINFNFIKLLFGKIKARIKTYR